MGAGELLIDTTTAHANHLSVGSVVAVKFAQTGSTTMRIGGIFKPNPLLGSFVTADGFFHSRFDDPLPIAVLLSTAPGARGLGGALNRALLPYANVGFKTRADFEASQQASVNQLLGLVYVLLALAVLIALIGIVNTLMLSVFERTREIGLLRAVGMKRRQIRAMIRSEAVVIAVFGAFVGIIVGTGLGAALAASLRENGVTNVAIPLWSLIGFLIVSAVLGLAAAAWPARRAASLDVLAAIATE
jgi:putative ABC transport system permease protein